jgi:TrmH family RNA methyltransferase
MITLRKLRTFPSGTRLRKTVRLLQRFEAELREGSGPDTRYLLGLLEILREDLDSGEALRVASRSRGAEREALREEAGAAADALEDLSLLVRQGRGSGEGLRALNGLRHALLALLAMEPGEWDLLPPGAAEPGGGKEGEPSSPSGQRRFDIAVYLEDIRSPFNVGSIARSAEAFGAAGLILSEGVPKITHPRAQRASMGAFEHLPVARCSEAASPGDHTPPPRASAELPVFALEVGGTPLSQFTFPRRGVCLLGSEELGLSPEALALADRSWGRCAIPLYGAKGSLNVGVAAGILLARWTAVLDEEALSGGRVSGDTFPAMATSTVPGVGQKKDPAETRQGLFAALLRDFCHGLRWTE